MNKVNIYSTCSGINNKIDPARLSFNPENGITDLSVATDILIDQTGGITSRRGSSVVAAGSWHSRHKNIDGSFYAIQDRTVDAAIFKVIPKHYGAVDTVGIRSGMTKGAKVSFCLVDGKVYYMNGYENGVIIGDVSHPWPESEWFGPDDAQMEVIPSGSFLDMFAGRFIIGKGNEIVWTEPGIWGLVDAELAFQPFESAITMVYALSTGIYVSDESSVWWLAGSNPEDWTPVKALNYPAIAHCREQGMIDPSFHGFQTSSPSALFGTVNGPVIGLPNGQCTNLIDKRVSTPQECSTLGTIMVVDETTIIMSGV